MAASIFFIADLLVAWSKFCYSWNIKLDIYSLMIITERKLVSS